MKLTMHKDGTRMKHKRTIKRPFFHSIIGVINSWNNAPKSALDAVGATNMMEDNNIKSKENLLKHHTCHQTCTR